MAGWYSGRRNCGCCGGDGGDDGGGGGGGSPFDPVSCGECAGGFAPAHWIVTISGVVDNLAFPSDCYGWCDPTLNGTYIVQPLEGLECTHLTQFDLVDSPLVGGAGINDCSPSRILPGLAVGQMKGMEIGVKIVPFLDRIDVDIRGLSNDPPTTQTGGAMAETFARYRYNLTTTYPHDCVNTLTNVLTTFKVSSDNIGGNLCDDSNATVTIQGVY